MIYFRPRGGSGKGDRFLSNKDILSPSDLMGYGKFTSWYPGQLDLYDKVMDWFERPRSQYLGLSVPTGSGKSLTGLLLANQARKRVEDDESGKITAVGVRTAILTATKGLTRQYIKDARGMGGREARGQNNFYCLLNESLTVEEGPCRFGVRCNLLMDCPYYRHVRKAIDAPLVITNYAYWLAQTNHSSGLGKFDLVICDEAHLAFGALEGFLTIYLSRFDTQSVGLVVPGEVNITHEGWRQWAARSREKVDTSARLMQDEVATKHKRQGLSESSVPTALAATVRRYGTLSKRLEGISGITDDWIIQRAGNGIKFTPKWVAEYSHHLFHPQKTPKIMLMSAILSPRTADYLGVPENREWIEERSFFPPENTPIWHIPTARINYRTDGTEMRLWVSRIDQIIKRRLDRKGIIFTVSYERARLLMANSRYKGIMFTHGTRDVSRVVDMFKEADPPAVLVSPSVTTGYDFPMQDQSQYIIVGKLPYPITADPVAKARHQDDVDWSSYLTMETLVQSAGRMTRSAKDRCEVFVVDDNVKWFLPRFAKFAPEWFVARYRGTRQTVPDPLL